jgi:DeoR/GlpR family transcriptional regulator of sugar metabolism
MLTTERRNYILEVLKSEGRVVALSLSEMLNVSVDTIRRDLRDLAAEGRLQRVHGGALPASPIVPSFIDRQRHLTSEKVSIASRAAQLVRDGMVVVMGGGITNVQTAEHFPRDLRATVITHSPPLAMALADHPLIEVILAGGKLNKYSMVTVGVETAAVFQHVRADLCVLGVCSLHPEVGISDIDYEESQVNREMIACAGEVVALSTADKLGTAAPFVIGPLSDLNLIITGGGIAEEVLSLYRTDGVEVIQV